MFDPVHQGRLEPLESFVNPPGSLTATSRFSTTRAFWESRSGLPLVPKGQQHASLHSKAL